MSKCKKILCMLLVVVIFSSVSAISALAYETQTITITSFGTREGYLIYCDENGDTFTFYLEGGQAIDPPDSPYILDTSNTLFDYWGNGDWYMSGALTLFNYDTGVALDFTVQWTTASGGKVAYLS